MPFPGRVFEDNLAITHAKDTIKGHDRVPRDERHGRLSGTGKYKFKLTGNRLRFTVISDSSSCAGGKDVLTRGAFTKTS